MFLKNLSRWASVELIPTNSISGCVQGEILYIYVSIPKKGESDLLVHPWDFSFALPRSQADKSGHGQIDYDECGNLGDVDPLEPLDHLTDRNLSKSTISEIYRYSYFLFFSLSLQSKSRSNEYPAKKQHWLQGSTQRPSIPDGPQKCCNSISDFFCRIILVCQIVGSSSQGSFCSQLYFCALCCCILKSTGGGNSSLEPTKRNKVEPHIESE